MCLTVLPVCMLVHLVHAVHLEVRKGHWIPRKWSCTIVPCECWIWTQDHWQSSQSCYLQSDLSSLIFLLFFKVSFLQFLTFWTLKWLIAHLSVGTIYCIGVTILNFHFNSNLIFTNNTLIKTQTWYQGQICVIHNYFYLSSCVKMKY